MPHHLKQNRRSKLPTQQAHLDRGYKDFQNDRAVCLVSVDGDSCTGTLLRCNGAYAVLCSSRVIRTPVVAAAATVFFEEHEASVKLEPCVLFCELAHDLVLVGVQREALRVAEIDPLIPSQEALLMLAETMSSIGTGPPLDAIAHINGAAKKRLELNLDDYVLSEDRVYFQEQQPVEEDSVHGSPFFHDEHLVGFITEGAWTVKRGIGVGALLCGADVHGVTARSWPPRLEQPVVPADLTAMCMKAVKESNVELLVRLRSQFGDLELQMVRVNNGWTLAHVAATVGDGGMLSAMAGFGWEFPCSSFGGDTVAHVAAYNGNVGALRVLRSIHAPLDATNRFGRRPIDGAIAQRHAPVIDWYRRRGLELPPLNPQFEDAEDRNDHRVTRFDRKSRREEVISTDLPANYLGFGTVLNDSKEAYDHAAKHHFLLPQTTAASRATTAASRSSSPAPTDPAFRSFLLNAQDDSGDSGEEAEDFTAAESLFSDDTLRKFTLTAT